MCMIEADIRRPGAMGQGQPAEGKVGRCTGCETEKSGQSGPTAAGGGVVFGRGWGRVSSEFRGGRF